MADQVVDVGGAQPANAQQAKKRSNYTPKVVKDALQKVDLVDPITNTSLHYVSALLLRQIRPWLAGAGGIPHWPSPCELDLRSP
jgi:hypothetical protein